VVAADEYERAFDAAVEAARVDGLPAALRDRRSGIIETEARIAPSIRWRARTCSARASRTST
jgi:hypothetical protein